ncbi:MAG: hypothetical protein WA374_03300 [Acidobacteriaceae bacterium]
MLPSIRRLPSRIFGAMIAFIIVLAVRFFERRFRLNTRRDPAWRSQ